jgi:hypothetical protein
MHKSLPEWTVQYLEQIEDSEHSHLEFKCSETIKDIQAMGDVVSAFANYDGGHIILGVKDRRGVFKVEPDGLLDLGYKGDLRSWLEDKIPTLSERGVRSLDVKTFSMQTGSVAVVEIRESDDAPHQDARTKQYYGRTGSKCTPLSHRQIIDIIQRRKSPILEISPIEIESRFDPDSGPHEVITFRIKNVGMATCKRYHLQIELPTSISGRSYIFPDEHQPEFNGIQRIFTDLLSDKLAHVVEIDGGLIYPHQEKTKAFRGFECKINGETPANYLSGREKVRITLYADPTPIIRGETEMLPIRKNRGSGLTLR